MVSTGHYCEIEDGYDIDSIINEVSDKTKIFIQEQLDRAKTYTDSRKLLRAMLETVAEKI